MKTQERKRVLQYFLFIGVFLLMAFTLKATNAPVTTAATVCNAVVNQQVTVPITVTGFSNISGFTLTMDYDFSKLHFVKASSTSNSALGGTCDIGEINMGGNNRRVTISWYRNGTPGITLPDGTAIANYVFTYISGPAILTWFDMGPSCVYNDPDVNTLSDTPTSTYYINGLVSGSCLDIPTITANGPISFCEGGSVELTASAGSAYKWSPGGATTQKITVTTSGSYTVEVTDAGGAKATSEATLVTVSPLPTAPTADITQSTCYEATGTITVSSTKTGLTFSIDGSTYTNNNGIFSGLSSGDYHITSRNAAGCVSPQSPLLTINAQPTAPLAPTANITQPTSAVPTGTITVSSDKTGLTFSIDGSTYTNTSGIFSGLSSGDYHVTARNAAGCFSPQSILLTIYPINDGPVTTAPTLTACVGTNINVPITVTGFNTIGAVSLILNYDPLVLSFNSGTNTGGFPGLLIGNSTPGIVIIGGYTSNPTGYSIVNGSVVCTLNFTYLGGSTALSWFDDGGSCEYAGPYPDITILNDLPQAAFYINGSVGPASITKPIITASGSTNFCAGENVNLTSSVGASYLWSTGATTQSINVTTSGNFTVTVTDAGGCKATSESTVVTVTQAPEKPTLNVTPPTCANSNGSVAVTSVTTGLTFSTDGTNYATYTTPFTVAAGANYSITAKNISGCVSIAATGTMGAALTAPVAPTVNVVAATCGAAGSASIGNYSAANTYIFTPSDGISVNGSGNITGFATGQSYTVKAKNAANCESAASASFTIANALEAPAQPTVNVVAATCGAAGSASITNFNSANSYTFAPEGPNVNVNGNITGFTTGQSYTVKAKNAANCESAASASFTIANALEAPAQPTVNVVAATCGAAGSASIGNYSAANTYMFTPSDGISVNGSGTITGFATAQSYTVKAKNTANCESVASASFTIQNALEAPAQPTVNVVAATCGSAGSASIGNYSAANTYMFTPSDGISVNGSGNITGFATGQSYTVKAKNTANCESTASASFTIANALEAPAQPTVNIVAATCGAAGSASIGNYSAANTYMFTPSDGISVNGSGNITGFAIGQSYTVKAKNTANCESAASASFTIANALEAPVAPTVNVVNNCDGTSTLTASGHTGTLLWSTAETSASITVTVAGTYTVTQKVNGCTSAPGSGTAEPKTAPAAPTVNIVITSGSNPTCSGSELVFIATPTNGGSPAYQWKKDGSDVGTNSATYTDDGTTAGSISVVMTSTLDCATSPTATSNVIDLLITSSGEWLGIISSDWNTASNWCGGIPTSSTDVFIPFEVLYQPVIGVGTSASCHNINIEGEASLTIASDATGTGSLIVSGSVSGAGSASVKRYMTTDAWHIVASPVSGQGIHDFLLDNDNIAVDETTADGQEHDDGTIRGMMDYNADLNVWNDYFKNSQGGNLDPGKGFSIRTDANSPVTFSGKLNAGPITVGGLLSDRWNCIGNPYTSAIGINENSLSTANFLKVNAIDNSNLHPAYSAIYIWDNTDASGNNGVWGKYTIISNTPDYGVDDPYHVQQGQAFMVLMNEGAGSVSFTSAMQTHLPGLAIKSGDSVWPMIKLEATVNSQKSVTTIAFNDRMTKGLDVTYDAGLLRGGSDLVLYSKLVQDNGIPFAIQALPANDFSKMVIPLGIESKNGGDVVFSSKFYNLPSDCQVILEDKLNKTFTDLSQRNYKTTITANSVIPDRFQIHTSYLTTGVNVVNLADQLTAYAIRNVEIRVKGQVSKQAVATLYDIQGRVILAKNLEEGSLNTIQTPNIKTAIYLLIVNDNGKSQSFKIPVKE